MPREEDWQYVKVRFTCMIVARHNSLTFSKPLEGHAICNIGDALNVFSGGIMRSNIHRVV